MCLSITLCIHMCVCIHMRVCIHPSMHSHACVYVSIPPYIHMCVYIMQPSSIFPILLHPSLHSSYIRTHIFMCKHLMWYIHMHSIDGRLKQFHCTGQYKGSTVAVWTLNTGMQLMGHRMRPHIWPQVTTEQ